MRPRTICPVDWVLRKKKKKRNTVHHWTRKTRTSMMRTSPVLSVETVCRARAEQRKSHRRNRRTRLVDPEGNEARICTGNASTVFTPNSE